MRSCVKSQFLTLLHFLTCAQTLYGPFPFVCIPRKASMHCFLRYIDFLTLSKIERKDAK